MKTLKECCCIPSGLLETLLYPVGILMGLLFVFVLLAASPMAMYALFFYLKTAPLIELGLIGGGVVFAFIAMKLMTKMTCTTT